MAALQIRSGVLIAHRLVDAADAIDLARAEALWQSSDGRRGRRTALRSVTPNELAYETPPLSLALPAVTVDLDGDPVAARMSARLYDFGAITLEVRVDVTELPWDLFVARCNALDRTLGSAADSDVWRNALDTVRAAIGPALHRPSQRHLEEDYLVAIVHRCEPALGAAEFPAHADLPALLAADARPLAPAQRAELTAHAYSYYADDLVVLTWDRAFVLEPRQDTDVVDIIEIANAQLLEMRYYDELLDAELARMYDLVANTGRGGLTLLASRRAARLARRLHGLVAEVTQLTEKVENTLQVTEDVYLARVHGAALDLFRVPKLSAAVDRKLTIIRDTYSALYHEASSRRAELLELAIVLLIMFEIVLVFVR